VIDNCAVAVFAPAPFTPIKNVEVPAVVGVPEITPVLALIANPAGSAPEYTLHVYGFVPLVAAIVAEYAPPTIPFGKLVVVIRTIVVPYTVKLKLAVEDSLSLSVTFAVNVSAATAVVGLPDITPVLDASVNPAGKLPELTLHVYGGVPPIACSVAEYSVPTAAVANNVVVTFGTGFTVSVAEPCLLPPHVNE
jgi:hypothetical protein